MEQVDNSKNRKVWMIVGILVVVGAVAGVVIYALASSSTKSESSTTQSTPWPRVATKDEVSQNLSDLKASMEQANEDSAAAKAAMKDNDNQVKVGN